MTMTEKRLKQSCENLAERAYSWIREQAVNDAVAHAAIWMVAGLLVQKGMEISYNQGGEQLVRKNTRFFVDSLWKHLEGG